MKDFCVLVASADDRKDIFDTCFAHSQRIWQECDWPRFVGLNTPGPDIHGFKVVTSAKTEWREAVSDYLDALPQEINYVLLMAEDTLFMEPIDGGALQEQASWISSGYVPYLRLVPIRRNWIGRTIHSAVKIGLSNYEVIPPSNPYYSSTEMALWRRTYLRGLLNYPTDAWEFEKLITGIVHYAVSFPIFRQHQIVQKGRWNWDAPRYLAQAGLPPPPPGRPYQSPLARARGQWQNINFALFGFTSVRIKRWLRYS